MSLGEAKGRFTLPLGGLVMGIMMAMGCGDGGIPLPTTPPEGGGDSPTPTAIPATPTQPQGPDDTPEPTPIPTATPTASATPSPTPGTPEPSPTPTRDPGTDADRDGWTIEAGDCDDGNNQVYPGAEEVCDGQDNDCDKYIDAADDDTVDAHWYYPDNDEDRFGDPEKGVFSCKPVNNFLLVGTDCNDGRADINPDAPEICDAYDIDEDCDGYSDDDDPSVEASSQDLWYPDRDLDGFGDANTSGSLHCDNPSEGYSLWLTDHRDCNDGDPWVKPSSDERCDGQDTDCDGDTDEGFDWDDDGSSDCIDDDNDGYTERQGDCDDTDADVYPFSPYAPDNDQDGVPDICDNCVWVSNEEQADADEDGIGDLCAVNIGEWGEPEPVAELNTDSVNAFPYVSADGLEMYFVSHRNPTLGSGDIWRAHRKSRDVAFGNVESLGEPINSDLHESQPTLTADGLTLFFARSTGEFEDSDIFQATRKDPLLPFDTPVAVKEVNTPDFGESHPFISPDGLRLYFSSNRDGTTDIYVATRSDREHIFGSPQLVVALSTEFGDRSFMLRSDGRWGYLTSSRSDGSNSDLYDVDISADGQIQLPVSMKTLSHDAFDGGGSVTGDGKELYFYTSRAGEYQIWRSLLIKPEELTPTPGTPTPSTATPAPGSPTQTPGATANPTPSGVPVPSPVLTPSPVP